MKHTLTIAIIVALAALGYFYFTSSPEEPKLVATSFEECAAQGNAVMESYPRQCIDASGNHFTEDVTAEWESAYTNASDDLIRNINTEAGDSISSPITITGEARGYWFFEASFPIIIVDWNGRIIAEHYATAEGDWMTEEFVPFTATLEFETPPAIGVINRGAIILKNDNPSGLPENDRALEIPITFE